ncbi:MAG: bifunctional phosphopantothenoylcysteine decarboxylase/phosphopantothenate--cysteine ligase CoaBC [Phycisphaerales bacterium]|nr:MAG: bifunctional phosphopantothenoylcysteine decarboxylase/phosphopantothenate--cysteine ligase CoaBC [Phycisphaerales bacterium]
MKAKDETSSQADLAGYEILIAVCGGIAAYKVCQVVSHLAQRGCGVTVAMTKAARKFVGPVTFQALTGRKVLTSLWSSADPGDVQHIRRTEEADAVLIAPATANIIGKMAGGIADDLVSTLVISAASPIVLAPAMNERMWASPAVAENIAKLKERGCLVVGPNEGWLACRGVGPGRMSEPDEIIEALVHLIGSGQPKRSVDTS